MFIGLDHSTISLDMEDLELELNQDGDPHPTSTWIQSGAPLFRPGDLETLEGQAEAVGDIGASTS